MCNRIVLTSAQLLRDTSCRYTTIRLLARGRAFFWGGIGLGLLFAAALLHLTDSGRSSESAKGGAPGLMTRQGERIVVPEGSSLRDRLSVMPAPVQPVEIKLVLPAVVESDPARTALVLPALGGRVLELKVALGERVVRGQVLALIDSPDLAQAYDDNDKAADAFKPRREKSSRGSRSSPSSVPPRTRIWTRPRATPRRPPPNT